MEEKLGEGAYGIVCKCRNRRDGKTYAVKVIEMEGDNDAAVRKEVEILKKLDSDTVVRYGGCYRKGSTLLIAMEFCDGGSVQDILRVADRQMKEDEIAAVCAQVLDALVYLHSHHVMHRDIKAGNVLLTTAGRAKLADFGVSAPLQSTLQRQLTVIGSPYWMAPEIISKSNEGYDTRADIWSLGITAMEMAEKEPPRYDIHFARVIFVIPQQPPPTFKNPALWSNEFKDFVAQCLNKDPKKRPTAKQLLRHPFIVKGSKKPQLIAQLVEETYSIIQERRAELEAAAAEIDGEDEGSGTILVVPKGQDTMEIRKADDSGKSDTFVEDDLIPETNDIKGLDYAKIKTYV